MAPRNRTLQLRPPCPGRRLPFLAASLHHQCEPRLPGDDSRAASWLTWLGD